MNAIVETLLISLPVTLALIALYALVSHVVRHRLRVRRARLIRSIQNHPAGKARA